jgi:hypothetical protein
MVCNYIPILWVVFSLYCSWTVQWGSLLACKNLSLFLLLLSVFFWELCPRNYCWTFVLCTSQLLCAATGEKAHSWRRQLPLLQLGTIYYRQYWQHEEWTSWFWRGIPATYHIIHYIHSISIWILILLSKPSHLKQT